MIAILSASWGNTKKTKRKKNIHDDHIAKRVYLNSNRYQCIYQKNENYNTPLIRNDQMCDVGTIDDIIHCFQIRVSIGYVEPNVPFSRL